LTGAIPNLQGAFTDSLAIGQYLIARTNCHQVPLHDRRWIYASYPAFSDDSCLWARLFCKILYPTDGDHLLCDIDQNVEKYDANCDERP
jgi:glutathione S-transferase